MTKVTEVALGLNIRALEAGAPRAVAVVDGMNKEMQAKFATAGREGGAAFGTELEKSTKGIGGIFTKIGETAGQWGIPFSNEFSKIGKDFAELETKGQSFSKAMAVTGGATVAALAGIGIEAVHLSDQFETAQAQLETAVKNSSQSWGAYSEQVDQAETSAAKLGFTNTDVAGSLTTLTTATNDPKKALQDLGLVEDMARMKHESLGDASSQLSKILGGNTRVLQQWGINLDIGSGKLKSIQSAEEAVQSSQLNLNTVQAKINDGQLKGISAASDLAKARLSLRNANLNLSESETAIPKIMDALEQRTKNAAQAYSKTLPGAIDVAKADVHDIGVAFGEYLTPKVVTAEHALGDVVGFFERNHDAGEALAGVIGGTLTAAVTTFALRGLTSMATGLAGTVANLGRAGTAALQKAGIVKSAADSEATSEQASADAVKSAIAQKYVAYRDEWQAAQTAAQQIMAANGEIDASTRSSLTYAQAQMTSYASMARKVGVDVEAMATDVKIADSSIVAENEAVGLSWDAMLGPIGLVVGAGTALFALFAGKGHSSTSQLKTDTQQLAQQYENANQSMAASSASYIQLQITGNSKLIADAKTLGLSLGVVENAALGNSAAMQQVANAQQAANDKAAASIPVFKQQYDTVKGYSTAAVEASGSLTSEQKAANDVLGSVNELRQAQANGADIASQFSLQQDAAAVSADGLASALQTEAQNLHLAGDAATYYVQQMSSLAQVNKSFSSANAAEHAAGQIKSTAAEMQKRQNDKLGTSIPSLGSIPSVGDLTAAGSGSTPKKAPALTAAEKAMQEQEALLVKQLTGAEKRANTPASIDALIERLTTAVSSKTGLGSQARTLGASLNATKNSTLEGDATALGNALKSLKDRLASTVQGLRTKGNSDVESYQNLAQSGSYSALLAATTGQAAKNEANLVKELNNSGNKSLQSLATTIGDQFKAAVASKAAMDANLKTYKQANADTLSSQVGGFTAGQSASAIGKSIADQLANNGQNTNLGSLGVAALANDLSGVVTGLKDAAQLQHDAAAAQLQAAQDSMKIQQDAASAQVTAIQDASQAQVDQLGERGLYGVALQAQMAKVALDQQKQTDDAAVAAAQAHLDQVTAQSDASVARAQYAADAAQQSQDAQAALNQASADSQAIVDAINVQTAQNKVTMDQYASQQVQAADQAAVTAAQATANAADASIAAANQNAINLVTTANQNAQNAYQQAQDSAAQQVQDAQASLQAAQSTASITEAKMQSQVNYLQELASIQFSGSGTAIYITGLPMNDASAISAAASYALRYKVGAA